MDARCILHVDLDAFFASVEQRDDPSLRGKPVVVGGSRERGVVAAASYEARSFGVHSAMPMAEALRRCPEAVVVEHHMDRYLEASRSFFTILEDFTPLVEGLSVDEAFLDITGVRRLLGSPEKIAMDIRARVTREIDLVASVGVAPTKFAAKIASDIDKPDGLRIVEAQDLLDFLRPLPVSRLWGVGKVTQEKLALLGLRTIGELAGFPVLVLKKKLGPNMGQHLHSLAQGHDSRGVEPGRDAVSVGNEETFEHDVADPEEIRKVLLRQADKVARRLRKSDLRARTLVLKIKFADFKQITRQKTLSDPSSDGQVLADTANALLAELKIDGSHGKSRKVRLCGVTAANLEARQAPRQLSFHEESRAQGERLGDLLDSIKDRFGEDSVKRATHTRLDES